MVYAVIRVRGTVNIKPDIKRTLEAKYKDTKVKVSAKEGVTRNSDIQIQLVPK